jgi:glycosyltransferase involved in cell wall biosynthesis
MKIALISSLNRPVSSHGNGGLPVFNYLLADGLKNVASPSDHLTLFTSGNSSTTIEKFPIIPEALFKDHEDAHLKNKSIIELENDSFDRALIYINKNNYDIVHHNHFNAYAIKRSVELGLKTIVSVHVTRDVNFIRDLIDLNIIDQISFIAISHSIIKMYPEITFKEIIPNGIDLREFEPNYNLSKKYFSWIGRIIPEKGLYEALEVVEKLNAKLIFAGPIADPAYFEKIRSRFDPKIYEYLGIIDSKQRNQLLNRSTAMLFPLQAEEPFGLTVIESLAAGTPVLTLDRGDMRNIITDGVTGFVSQDLKELIEKAALINTLSRQACRKSAEDNFSHIAMARKYYEFYTKQIKDN